jgi:transposase
VTNDDALYRCRLRVMAAAAELGNVRAACRMFGVHHSTYYRWKALADRQGLEMLRPRERRAPRMPNAIPVVFEQRILAYALAFPGHGPNRVSSELARRKWGGLKVSSNGVWRVLRRHGLSTRRSRLALVAGYQAPPEPARPEPPAPQHIHAEHPGQLVQMDCFYVGRLTGHTGVLWQYTAIDVASSYLWAELHATAKNPSSKVDLRARSPRGPGPLRTGLEARGGEHGQRRGVRRFRLHRHRDEEARGQAPAHQAGRPQSNGCIERVQLVLDECWKPAFARFIYLTQSGLGRELATYVRLYNTDRAHNGYRNKGRTPEQVIGKAKMYVRA